MPPPRRPVVLAVVATAAVLPAAFTLDPGLDNDTWWHLRVGREVAASRSVPQFDTFSRLGRESPTPWRAYSWLYELGLYGAYSAAGIGGVMAVRVLLAAVSAAGVFAFVGRRCGDGWAGLATTLLAAAVLMPFGKERPWHLTILFTTLTLDAVVRMRDGELVRRFVWLPVMFVVWANVHIQFALGWLVLGLACLFPGMARRTHLLAVTAGCVLASFGNPYHVRLLGVIWEYATQAAPLRLVQELAPPHLDQPWTRAVAALLVWGWLSLLRNRRDWFLVALLLAATVLSLRMRRDIWFGAVAAVAVIGTPPIRFGGFRSQLAIPAVVVAVFLAVRLLNSAGFGPATDYAAAQGEKFPGSAATFTRETDLPGPLFNDFDWGGYLIWALPEQPVAVDGRTNLYGSERLLRSFATWDAAAGWDRDPLLASARLVIASKRKPLTDVLRRTPPWRVAFEDGTAVVFVR